MSKHWETPNIGGISSALYYSCTPLLQNGMVPGPVGTSPMHMLIGPFAGIP